MGQRANFEEQYSGETYQGSYIGGVYYPDKTKVGWWKNGYPKYFAKVLNAPNWIGINIRIAGIPLDLNRCIEVSNFRRELDMKRGIYKRSFKLKISTDIQVAVNVTRFLSMVESSLGVINYQITMIKGNAEIDKFIFVHGHVHTPRNESKENLTIYCQGATGLPFDEDPRGAVAFLSVGQNVEWEVVRYDYDKSETIDLLEELKPPFYTNLQNTVKYASIRNDL